MPNGYESLGLLPVLSKSRCMPVLPALERQRQKSQVFKVALSYVVISRPDRAT